MMLIKYLQIIAVAGLSGAMLNSSAQPSKPPADAPYRNARLPVEARVRDLLQRMTPEEKVAQVQCLWIQKKKIMDAKGAFSRQGADSVLWQGIGQIGRINEGMDMTLSRSPRETVLFGNEVQRYLIEHTRLGIPAIFHEESLHGNQAKDATHLPSHLAMAATWNTLLLEEAYSMVAREVRARGAHQVLAPVVDLGRDPRWGRTEETLGEDPYLAARIAVAEIKAYQGAKQSLGKDKVIATLKHFPVHGTPEGGVNIAPSFVDERTYREVNFPSFKAAVVEGGALGVMPCYNELSGVPAHANGKLINGVLRREWGFQGIVVSDYFAINELQQFHKVSGTKEQSALMAMQAGVDIELPDRDVYPYLLPLVNSGRLPMAVLDTAVARILRLKFRLGLFESPYTLPDVAEQTVGAAAHRTIARKAAAEGMVLLKNDGNILPLNAASIKKLALIGPNANQCILGGYSNEPKYRITPLQALQEYAQGKFELVYSEGSRITDRGDWWQDTVVLSSREDNLPRIAAAVAAARDADVIVLCLGGNAATFREAWSYTHMGDLTNLELFGTQNDLVAELAKLKKPMVAAIFSGPPMTFGFVNKTVPAILNCWFAGQETGNALTDVLFGHTEPAGRLPISIPRSVGHIPAYYNYKPSARRGYHFDDISPMYAFGYGLGYTDFRFTNLQLSRTLASDADTVWATVTVTNTGQRTGSTVVQLYLRDQVSSVTRPVKELKGFEKITLIPGESRQVRLPIYRELLSFYNLEMQWVTEPGSFDVMVGPSSMDKDLLKTVFEWK